jgi:methylenetetrahydrofolate reductase (NADPH)
METAREISRLAGALEAQTFVVTAELNPPKGTNLEPLLKKAAMLKDRVYAFNLTDSHTSRMTVSPVAVARILLDRGIESILQVTCRDRNRIALQSDLLGAFALGIRNVLCMTGDDPKLGDHPNAKPVFDLGAITLLEGLTALQSGYDIGGNALQGTPSFWVGAVANPGADDLETELERMQQKIEAGAQFFQTQAIYDPRVFDRFVKAASEYNVPILPSVIPLKSAKMAQYFNDHVPGVVVPQDLIAEMAAAPYPQETSVQVASRLIKALRPMCQGIHLIAMGWESRIPQILDDAGIGS